MRTPPFPRETIPQPARFHCQAVSLARLCNPLRVPRCDQGRAFLCRGQQAHQTLPKAIASTAGKRRSLAVSLLPASPPHPKISGPAAGCERPQPGWGKRTPTPQMGRGRFASLPPPTVLVLLAAPRTTCFGLWVHATRRDLLSAAAPRSDLLTC